MTERPNEPQREHLPDYPTPGAGQLRRLQAKADEFCHIAADLAINRGRFPESAVNWADFSCVEATFVVDQDDNWRWMVVLAEASPDNPGLAVWFQDMLVVDGWSNVEVNFEW